MNGMFKKSLSSVFALICIALLSFGASAAGTVNGSIVTKRDAATYADSAKFAYLTVCKAGTEEAVWRGEIENPQTQGPGVSFSVELSDSGVYDLRIDKPGYLSYVMKNIAVYETGNVNLPEFELYAGDIDLDNRLLLNDVVLAIRAFDTSAAFDEIREIADINEDGKYDFADWELLKSSETFAYTLESNSTFLFNSSYGDHETVYNGDAYYLMDDSSFANGHTGVQSGWKLFDYGAPYSTTNTGATRYNAVVDSSVTKPSYAIRPLQPISEGKLKFETAFTLEYSVGGAYFSLGNQETGLNAFLMNIADNGTVVASGTATAAKASAGYNTLISYIDLDAKKYTLYVNGTDCGEFDFSDAAITSVDKLEIGSDAAGVATIYPHKTRIIANYLVNDDFLMMSKAIHSDWTAVNTTLSDYNNYENVAALKSTSSLVSSLRKNFGKTEGVVSAEYKYIQREMNSAVYDQYNGFTGGLYIGDTPLVTVYAEDSFFYTGSGQQLAPCLGNIWNTIRILADMTTNTATIKLNGKVVGENIPFENRSFYADTIKFVNNGKTATPTITLVDHIKVYQVQPEPDDYPSEPVVASSDDYLIGMNVCSLWRNGRSSHGWQSIAAFDELKSVLGYYDEGTPETADWEIKFMSEHGIDYQLYCWYPGQNNTTYPICPTDNATGAIFDGFMNAKYSDKMKFAIMWENAGNSGISADSMDAILSNLENYILPYWVEYLFKDERYQKVDNKPLITIYSPLRLVTDCGSEANAKLVLDCIRQACVDAGFDGAVILCSDQAAQKNANGITAIKRFAECGFDGCYAYHWATGGYDPYYQISRMNGVNELIAENVDGVYTTTLGKFQQVPTISIGMNHLGWLGKRTPFIKADELDIVMDHTKELLAANDPNNPLSKMCIASNWNEYGEGTIIMPCEFQGFSYLDKFRENFTSAGEHTHEVPDENQLWRINHMYDQDQHIIRKQKYTNPLDYQNYTTTYEYPISGTTVYNGASGSVSITNGLISGSSRIIRLKNFATTAAEDVDYIRLSIDIRVPADDYDGESQITVYYTTTDATGESESMRIDASFTDAEGYRYIYIPTYTSAKWKGTLNTIRFDIYQSYKINEITFLKRAPSTTVMINDEVHEFEFDAYTENGHVYAAIDPESTFVSKMDMRMDFDKANQKITFSNAVNTLEVTVGSKTAKLNGKNRTMFKEIYFIDADEDGDNGLPVVCLDRLASYLGYSIYADTNLTEYDGGTTLNIVSVGDTAYEIIRARPALSWQFLVEGDLEGWDPGIYSPSKVYNGCLNVVTTNTDPTITMSDLSVNASEYSKIQIKMSWECDTKSVAQIYFATDTSPNMSADKVATVSLPSASGSGTYTFNMSNVSTWTGTITKIRLDPIAAMGTASIDYIKFVK